MLHQNGPQTRHSEASGLLRLDHHGLELENLEIVSKNVPQPVFGETNPRWHFPLFIYLPVINGSPGRRVKAGHPEDPVRLQQGANQVEVVRPLMRLQMMKKARVVRDVIVVVRQGCVKDGPNDEIDVNTFLLCDQTPLFDRGLRQIDRVNPTSRFRQKDCVSTDTASQIDRTTGLEDPLIEVSDQVLVRDVSLEKDGVRFPRRRSVPNLPRQVSKHRRAPRLCSRHEWAFPGFLTSCAVDWRSIGGSYWRLAEPRAGSR